MSKSPAQLGQVGHDDGTLVEVRKIAHRQFCSFTEKGEEMSALMTRGQMMRAWNSNMGLRLVRGKKSVQWRNAKLPVNWPNMPGRGTRIAQFTSGASVVTPTPTATSAPKPTVTAPATLTGVQAIMAEVDRLVASKPDTLVIDEIKWRYLVLAALNPHNKFGYILMTGPTGTGKTHTVQTIARLLSNRPYFYFNLGATQDPRSTLIGNTHFKKASDGSGGTYVAESLFVKAIQTEGAIILMDELSRAHPDAANILMTVFDPNQRYLRIDEKDDSPTIRVAKGVTFYATANLGSEYTAARVMDRALLDRAARIEMEPLNQSDEFNLLKRLYPTVEEKMLEAVSKIADSSRKNVKSDNPKISDIVSTRQSIDIAESLLYGFSLEESAELHIYPFYDAAGGKDSPRTFMKQEVQKHVPAVTGKSAPFVPPSGNISKLPFTPK